MPERMWQYRDALSDRTNTPRKRLRGNSPGHNNRYYQEKSLLLTQSRIGTLISQPRLPQVMHRT
jgi:hypothetical protein